MSDARATELMQRCDEIAAPLAQADVGPDMSPQARTAAATTLDRVAAAAEKELVPGAEGLRGTGAAGAAARDRVAALFRALAARASWLEGREARGKRWLERAASLAESPELKERIREDQVTLVDAADFGAELDLAARGHAEKAHRALRAKRKGMSDRTKLARLDAILADPRRLLAPIAKAPSLASINGIGTTMYGKRSAASDGTYVSTLWAVIVFLPVWPIASYLVSREGNGWRFFGKVPRSAAARWYGWLALGMPALLCLLSIASAAYESSSVTVESRHLRAARSLIDDGRYEQAVAELCAVGATESASRRARQEELGREAILGALAPRVASRKVSAFVRSTGKRMAQVPAAAWFTPAVDAAVEASLREMAQGSGCGATCRELIEWGAALSPGLRPRRTALAVQASATCEDPSLLAATARWHGAEKKPCPPEIVTRLGKHLEGARHEGWDDDALAYLALAEPGAAVPVLLARTERSWKGEALEPALAEALPQAPEPWRALMALDREEDLGKRAAALEAIAEPPGLAEPQLSWHRAGVARRLAAVYEELHSGDPISYPADRVTRWASAAADLAPADLGLQRLAMRAAVEGGDFDGAISRAAAHASDEEMKTWLGIAHARAGRLEEAERTLSPSVDAGFGPFVKAFVSWRNAAEGVEKSSYDALRSGTADQQFIERLNALPEEKAQEEADAWVGKRVAADPKAAELRASWKAKEGAYTAAMELAMVELTLGRSLPPGDARQEKLGRAEKLFVDLRRVADDDPKQDLQLGQVYFWLGKEAEAAALFDKLEKEADGATLLEMGDIYRDLGRGEAARRVLEAAYGKLPEADRQGAAFVRALAADDLDDKIAWLGKCDAANPGIKAALDDARGDQLLSQGKYAEAVPHLEGAAAYYGRDAGEPVGLNNAGGARMSLFVATGDPAHLREAQRLMRLATELDRDEAITLGNYIHVLTVVGSSALAGDALRADLLHAFPSPDWMIWARPARTREAARAHMRAQPELRRAAELGARSMVLSSERDDAYGAQISYFQGSGDADALRRLRETLEAAPPARAESIKASRDGQQRKYDPIVTKSLQQMLARSADDLPRIRKAGHDPSTAWALVQIASVELSASAMGLAGASLDGALAHAEEAARIFDGPPTWDILQMAHTEIASRDLAAADPAYAAWVEADPDCDAIVRLSLYAHGNPAAAERLRADAHLRAAGELAARHLGVASTSSGFYDWLWLTLTGHARAEEARALLEREGLALERQRIDVLLSPQSSTEIGGLWLLARAFGQKELEEKTAAQARERKVLAPFTGS